MRTYKMGFEVSIPNTNMDIIILKVSCMESKRKISLAFLENRSVSWYLDIVHTGQEMNQLLNKQLEQTG